MRFMPRREVPLVGITWPPLKGGCDRMDQLIELVGKHYQWAFSGIGVALLLAFWKARRSSLPLVSQWQRGGAFSRNVQVANVGAGDRDHDAE
jgi:hypothetical protein